MGRVVSRVSFDGSWCSGANGPPSNSSLLILLQLTKAVSGIPSCASVVIHFNAQHSARRSLWPFQPPRVMGRISHRAGKEGEGALEPIRLLILLKLWAWGLGVSNTPPFMISSTG